jgi:hypothetical protein
MFSFTLFFSVPNKYGAVVPPRISASIFSKQQDYRMNIQMNKCIKPLDPFPTDLPLSPSLALLLRKLE